MYPIKSCNRLLLFILCISILLLQSACIRYRNLVYLQTNDQHTVPIQKSQYKIHPNDDLKIEFTSTDPNTSALLNKETGLGQNSQVNNASLYVGSYTVDSLGLIDIPLLGAIPAKGLTLEQLSLKINKELATILKLKNVSVKMANARISILGEVKNPGTYYLYNDQTTLLQGLAMAGDLTDLGNRKQLKVVRNDVENKTSTIFYVNLTSPELLQSPCYYLFPNDAIYVEPVKAKTTRLNLPIAQVTLTAVSAILLVVSLIVNAYYQN